MAVTIEETFQRPVGELTADVNEKLLEAPINALRLTLRPDAGPAADELTADYLRMLK
jgi:hypothetical protein